MRRRPSSTLVTALIVLVGVALASMILAGMTGDFGPGGMMRGRYGGPYSMMSGAHGWLAMALGWLGMLGFVSAVVLAVVWAVRSLSSTGGRAVEDHLETGRAVDSPVNRQETSYGRS